MTENKKQTKFCRYSLDELIGIHQIDIREKERNEIQPILCVRKLSECIATGIEHSSIDLATNFPFQNWKLARVILIAVCS